MEQNDLDLQNPIINEAFLSLTESLWGSVEERFEGLETIIDSLIYRLFREGPKAFEDFQNFFPPSTKQRLMGNEAYKTYVNTFIKVQGQTPNPSDCEYKTPSKPDLEQPQNGRTPGMNQSVPHKEQIHPHDYAPNHFAPPIDVMQDKMEESKSKETIQKREETPGSKLEVSQNLKNSVPKKVEVNNSIAISKVNNDHIVELEETFKKLKRDNNAKYDQNFTLVYGLGDQKIRKENIITGIVSEHKESDFADLFTAFRPFLFDLLKRREGFEEFVQILRRVSAKEKIKCQRMIKNLEVKDIIILLLESCRKESMAKLGPWLVNQYYPLPILYPNGKNTFETNLYCCFELMYQTRKMLITSIGTKNSENKGKSSLLSYLFSTKNPTYFSTLNGFTHKSSVDLYAKLPQENFEYIVADVNGYTEDPTFKTLTSKLLAFSQLGIIQITAQDAKEHPEANFANLIDGIIQTKSSFVILFRDYDEDEHNEILDSINKAMETYPNFLETITVPKMNSEQNFDVQNDRLEVLEAIKKVLKTLKSTSYWPIAEIKKSYDLNVIPMNSSQTIETELDKESRMIRSLLDAKLKESKSLYRTLFPCFWLDFLLNEEELKKTKMDINYADLTEAQVIEISKKYEEITQRIIEYKAKKSNVHPSELIKNICLILSSNDIARILLLSETINDWKIPLYEPIKQRYLELCADKKVVNEDQKKALEKEIEKLEVEMDDKDVTLDTFLDEIYSLYEAGKVGDAFGIEGIKDYIYSNMRQGAPINLVNGKTLTFGNKLLQELFENYENDNKKVYVVSIIGAQSSAKSTLLNVLFGCGFVTSAGRCTKGLYISLLEHPNGCHLLVIDTEGLLSVVARDHEFDNLITTMAFSCSHLVIINNKGEINTKLRDLLEICVYAMKHLKLTHIKPKIIFALRDIADDNPKVQQEMLIHMKTSLEQAASKLLININTLIDISEEDVFLLPSAFQLNRGENGAKIQTNNNLFSQKVLDMRNYIFKYLESANINSASVLNPKWFYTQTEQLWGDITQHGKDIMKAKNFLEIELKEDALDKVNLLFKKFNEIFCRKGRTLLEHQKNQLKGKNVVFEDNFAHLLSTEFNKMKNEALAELEGEVLNNEKYAAISSYHREFRETLEFYLGWQRQNFMSEWRSSLISYEAIKSVSDFKAKLKMQVDDILQSKGDAGAMSAHVLVLFEQIKQRSKTDFIQRLDQLQIDNINKLAPEIQGHFECAQQKKSRKDRGRIIIPSVGELIQKITIPNNRYDQSKWLKLNRVGEYWKKFSRVNMSEELETISKEFQALQNNLNGIISEVSTEEAASNIITVCVDSVKRMENDDVPVNFAAFMPCILLEAMYAQYCKTKEGEIARIKKLQAELEKVLVEEEKLVSELLDQSQGSYKRGETTAKKCYREIHKAFCQEREAMMHKDVMETITEEFPAPESANKKAYQNSFEVSNYENVVRYVLDINKFIKELYDKRIKAIAEFEIDKNLNKMKTDFLEAIHEAIAVAKKWYHENQNLQKVDLSTLYIVAQQSPILSPYFPDLYLVQLSDINAFIHGFETTLSAQLSNFDTQKELKDVIYKQVEEFLTNQYRTLVGCQARCPVCNNKCIKPDANHKDHHTNCHLLSAFSGVKERKTREVVLSRCFDTRNYKCKWYSGKEEYRNFDDYISKKYPEWRAEFPRKEEVDKHETEVPVKFIECWVACKDVLINYYRYHDKTPAQWEKQVPKEKRLKSNLVIPGYTDQQQQK